tara:strand:- start:15256 stop:15774 length:519 start_codon:yes stop_codon:yes gene_type:complete
MFRVVDTSSEPLLLLESSQVRIYIAKHNSTQLSQVSPLVDVTTPGSPAEGENFVEYGYGLYGILLTDSETDTLGTLTLLVTADDPGSLDFQDSITHLQVVENNTHTSLLTQIGVDLGTLSTDMDNRFDTVDTSTEALSSAVSTVDSNVDEVLSTVESIEAAQGSGISTSFVE